VTTGPTRTNETLRIEWVPAHMSSRETQRVLDEAGRSIAELNRALDAAAMRAVDIGASDILERIAAAKAVTRRGVDCLRTLRTILDRDNGDARARRHPMPDVHSRPN